MASAAEIQASIDAIVTDGAVILHEFCDAGLVTRLRDIATSIGEQTRDQLGERDIGIGSAAGYEEIVQRSPERWDVPISPAQFGVEDRDLPWWPIISRLLGDDAEHSFSGVVYSNAGAPAQCWHTDSPHVSAEHLPAHAVNVLMALHDIPLELGPTEFARGSHRLTNHIANPNLDRDKLIYQHAETGPESIVRQTDAPVPAAVSSPLKTGSCLVFDDRLLHRGLANRSEKTRYVAYFSYRAKGYSENTHFEAQRSLHRA